MYSLKLQECDCGSGDGGCDGGIQHTIEMNQQKRCYTLCNARIIYIERTEETKKNTHTKELSRKDDEIHLFSNSL